MNHVILPPSLVAIFQTESAHQLWVTGPLSAPNVGKVQGVDYLLSANATQLTTQITSETRLLVVGSDRGSVTEPLRRLVARACELNPQVRIIVYSTSELPELNPADTITKGTELSVERFVMEVAHAIDMTRNAPRAAEVFST